MLEKHKIDAQMLTINAQQLEAISHNKQAIRKLKRACFWKLNSSTIFLMHKSSARFNLAGSQSLH